MARASAFEALFPKADILINSRGLQAQHAGHGGQGGERGGQISRPSRTDRMGRTEGMQVSVPKRRFDHNRNCSEVGEPARFANALNARTAFRGVVRWGLATGVEDQGRRRDADRPPRAG
jgi:hypothetical protein